MAMPWTLEMHPFGNSGEMRPVKRYPGGGTSMATEEEVAVWGHVCNLQECNEASEALIVQLNRELAQHDKQQSAAAGGKRK